jgi:hypothetical protein
VIDNPSTEHANIIRAQIADAGGAPYDYLAAALRAIVDMAEQAYGDCGYYDPEDDESTEEHNPRLCMSHCDCGWGQLSAGFVLDEIGRILGVLPHG